MNKMQLAMIPRLGVEEVIHLAKPFALMLFDHSDAVLVYWIKHIVGGHEFQVVHEQRLAASERTT
ncbi:hypothetical protein F441_14636 [Phytophthora nicotianae CJ01A1]|uniref:Uncharacterized protein n=4 Tax=Phytophthora nicotianae TaxID=4792 RepID=V9ENH2_PHYNI|nr:hypothetical protein F443_14800 [Phytophthora nicotianae P1569]ETO68346.1 hypothetical protein F444_14806 [Phytophthora nicotianae P1976]ETP09502.1 hypothetical protein F441_14636 [Phytophthora nicotianae CJ01A1]ETP37564.1 hypothetical protein F442_14633 [Phytophthora nicotianae P10297]